jgi:hypothetical protein
VAPKKLLKDKKPEARTTDGDATRKLRTDIAAQPSSASKGEPGQTFDAKGKKKPAKKADDSITQWKSAMSFNSQSMAANLRETLERMKYKFKREQSERSYSQLYAIVPFPRVTYVFRFSIETPAKLTIDLYDIYPGTSGPLSFIEIPDLCDDNIHHVRKILRALTEKLPRPPWKFKASQRVQHGLLNLDILRAKKHWQAIGVAE